MEYRQHKFASTAEKLPNKCAILNCKQNYCHVVFVWDIVNDSGIRVFKEK